MSELIMDTRAAISRVVPGFAKSILHGARHRLRERAKRSRFERNLRPDDVFIVGHPKSGNTWLAYMLAIAARNDVDRRINISNIGEHVPVLHAEDARIEQFGQLTRPRLFRNEGPVYPGLYPRTIYILRDPRAVLLSYYHHCVHDTGETDWAIGDFVDEMLENGCIKRLEPFLIRWDRQVEDWTQRAKSQAVKIVSYEQLKQDCKGVLVSLMSFLGIDCDDELLEMAVQRGDFKSMRSEELNYGAESYPGEKGKKGFFVRKGKTDSWRREIPPEVVARIEERFAATMKRVGYLE
ncbi:MAG: sulfotransferase domain-containing protein [Akkermansiaceae bacterium]|nr:sulfotransferase domain-containing protein [Akkermansiaceae bacterium]NNM28104.1 sulfotransferase domain-containing protein [Akkermansiaceae bacterium]